MIHWTKLGAACVHVPGQMSGDFEQKWWLGTGHSSVLHVTHVTIRCWHPNLWPKSLASSNIKMFKSHIMRVTILRIFLMIFSRMGSLQNLHSQSVWRWKSWFPSKFLPTEPIHWSSVNQCLVVKTIFGFNTIHPSLIFLEWNNLMSWCVCVLMKSCC